MQKGLALILFLLTFVPSLLIASGIETANDTTPKSVTIGWVDAYDTLPHLTLEEITVEEYRAYQKTYKNPFVLDSSKLEFTDTTICINTGKVKHTYTAYQDDKNHIDGPPFSWAVYKGYIPSLNLYVLESYGTSETTTGSSFYLDGTSGIEYHFVTVSDNPNELPVLSQKKQFLVYYNNNIFGQQDNLIGILQVTKSKSGYGYKEFASIRVDGEINNLVWVDNETITFGLNLPTPKYYKAKVTGNYSKK